MTAVEFNARLSDLKPGTAFRSNSRSEEVWRVVKHHTVGLSAGRSTVYCFSSPSPSRLGKRDSAPSSMSVWMGLRDIS